MRQGARFLIGPLVGVAVFAVALTGCGSSGTDIGSVVSPPTTETTAAGQVPSTTEAVESTTSTASVRPVSTTIPPTAAATPVARTAAPTTAAPTPQAIPVPRPAAMTAQELAGLEAELAQIDAILVELGQDFAAD